MSVLVVGDTNVDLEITLPSDSSERVHANPDPRLLGGGSAANTAAALARLGVDCQFVGTVGDDSYGRFAVSSLEEAGVGTGLVETTAANSTVTVITVLPPNGDRLIYVWPPSGGAHGDLEGATAVEAVNGAEWLHVSGICLRVMPSRDAMLAAMEAARTQGVPVSLDLNLRLENWGWDGGFRDVVDAAVEQADIVLGSASDEISALAGIADPVGAATALAGDSRVVIARLGSEGAIAASPDGLTSAPGFDVNVVDTVGAGDAFNAGFIAAHLGQSEITECLRWGNAVAALTISQPGARATPGLAQIKALLAA